MNRCSICNHAQRQELEQAYVAGATFRDLSKRFDRGKSSIQAHIKKHVPAAAEKALDAANARDVEAGDSILDELQRLKDEARRLQAQAEKKKDVRAALTAIDKLTRIVELQARILGELRDRDINVTNVQIDQETATRMAEMFLARRSSADKPAQLVAVAPPSRVAVDCESRPQLQATENEAAK